MDFLRAIARRGLGALLLLACAGDRHASQERPETTNFRTQFPFEYEPASVDDDSDGLPPSDEPSIIPRGGLSSDAGVPEPDRTVATADTAYMRGDLLYTQHGNALMIVDVSAPDDLRLVGHYAHGRLSPTDMYIANDVVIAIYHDLDESSEEGGVERSVVRMIDVEDPEHIEPLFELAVEGQIVDSRLIGDVLYAIGRDEDCGACGPTQVYAFATHDRRLDLAGKLELPGVSSEATAPSLYATSDRLYIAQTFRGRSSTLQLVELADESAALVLGPRIELPGVVEHGGQMNVHDGSLRVVSAGLRSGEPRLFATTFDVDGAMLGQLELALPHDALELLVAFDGPRAYAAASDDDTAIAVLDLADAAEPLGSVVQSLRSSARALGVHAQSLLVLTEHLAIESGSVDLTRLDLETLETDAQADRVTVISGPNASVESYRELRFWGETSMLAFPVRGSGGRCSQGNGVQLVEVTSNGLELRGWVSSSEHVSVAAIHDGYLFVLDKFLQSFDLGDPDVPELRSEAGIVADTRQLALAGGKLARLSDLRIDVVALGDASSPTLRPGYDLAAAARADDACDRLFTPNLIGDAEHAYVQYKHSPADTTEDTTEVAIFDASGDGVPALLGTAVGPASDDLNTTFPLFASAPATLLLGGVLAFEQQRTDHQYVPIGLQIEVIDVSDAGTPSWTTLELAGVEGSNGLHRFGTLILGTHLEPTDDATHVSFYVDRVDIEDPAQPKLLAPINVPGALLGVLDNDHIATLDFADDTFFVRRVRLEEGRASIIGSYEVSSALQPEDFVLDGERLWMIASPTPVEEHKRAVLVLIDELDTDMPRARQIEPVGNGAIREVHATQHGLFVLGERRAWLIDAEGTGELEVVAELGAHACVGRVLIAGDDALCAAHGPVQRIPLPP